jgi:hypothetical protein
MVNLGEQGRKENQLVPTATSLIEVLRPRRANSPAHFLLHYSLGHGQHRGL